MLYGAMNQTPSPFVRTVLAALGASVLLLSPGPTGELLAQQALPLGSGLILGQVVDAATGRGIGGAVVTMNATAIVSASTTTAVVATPAAANTAAQVTPQTLIADENGKFVFHHLPKATYSLSAAASGFAGGSFGQTRLGGPTRTIDLDTDQRFTTAVVRIWKLASIAGSVADEHGDPIVNLPVRLLRRTLVSGRRRLSPAGSTTTDDRGMYRLSVLTPADYVVAVASTIASIPTSLAELYEQAAAARATPAADSADPRLKNLENALVNLSASGAPVATSGYRIAESQLQYNGTLSRLMPQATEVSRMRVFQTTFFPATPSAAAAQVISLKSGEERTGVDLRMQLVDASRVSGTVTGPDGPAPNLGVKLVPVDAQDWTTDSGYETATTATDAEGRFSLIGVPNGQYVLRVQRLSRGTGAALPVLSAEMPVAVSGSAIAGLGVILRGGVRLSGRIEFEGTAVRPAPDRLQQVSVILVVAEGRTRDMPPPTRIGPDGRFTMPEYLPGKYTITAGAPGSPWVLKSIQVAGRDVSQLALSLESSDIADVVIVYGDQSTQLSGSVQGATIPETDVLIVAFPANYQPWIEAGMPPRVSRTARPNKAGAFSFTNLPAGEYLVAAVTDERSADWQDIATLQKIVPLATRVAIVDGDKKVVQLRMVPIK